MRRADNLTTFKCRLSWNLGASTSWNPQGLSRSVMGLLYLYHYILDAICTYRLHTTFLLSFTSTRQIYLILIKFMSSSLWYLIISSLTARNNFPQKTEFVSCYTKLIPEGRISKWPYCRLVTQWHGTSITHNNIHALLSGAVNRGCMHNLQFCTKWKSPCSATESVRLY